MQRIGNAVGVENCHKCVNQGRIGKRSGSWTVVETVVVGLGTISRLMES